MTNYSTTHQQQQDLTDQLLLQDKDKAKMSGKLPHSESEKPELKIFLVGKTGAGMTSVMNTLMGRVSVPSLPSASSNTTECKTETREFDDYKLVITDTPGMFNTKLTKKELEKRIVETIVHAASGVHMFLLVLRPGEVSQGVMASMDIIQKIFGENTKDYTSALFISETKVKDEEVDTVIKDSVIKDGDYLYLDNFTKDNDRVKNILDKLYSIVQNRKEDKKMYTSEMLEKAQEIRKEEEEKLKKLKKDLSETKNLKSLLKAVAEKLTSEPIVNAIIGCVYDIHKCRK